MLFSLFMIMEAQKGTSPWEATKKKSINKVDHMETLTLLFIVILEPASPKDGRIIHKFGKAQL